MILATLILILTLIGIRNILFLIPIIFISIYQIIKKKYSSLLIIFLTIILGILLSIPISNFLPSYGIVITSKDNYVLLWANFQKYYVSLNDNDLEFFDIIKFDGYLKELEFYSLEGEFNFGEYLYNQMIEKEIVIYQYQYLFENPLKIKAFRDFALQNLNEEGKYFLSSLLFNISVNSDYRNLLNEFNVGFLFVISSLHLYLFYEISYRLLRFFNIKKYQLISILILLPFLYLSQFRLSGIKVLLLIINRELIKKKIPRFQILSFLLFTTLIFNPRFIYTSSFYYIFLMSNVTIFVFTSLSNFKKKHQKIIMPLMLNFLFLPLTIYYEGTYNVLNPFVATISSFLSEFIFILGLLSIFIFPLKYLLNFTCYGFLQLIKAMNLLPLKIYIDEKIFILFLIVLIVIAFYCVEIKYKKGLLITTLFLYGNLFVAASPLDSVLSSYVAFINVGQGDSCLIHHHNIDVLIDTGGSIYSDIGKDVLYPFLKRKHIYQLDYVFISHDDYDHIGGLDLLNECMEIDNIIVGNEFAEIEVGNITFYNLNPYRKSDDNNDNSSVIYFNFLNYKFLMMGDAGVNIETEIINNYPSLDVDILKVGHHGSNTSTSEAFLKQYSFSEAVISVGRNEYGHPHQEVLSLLNKYQIKIRRTDEEGSIYYYLKLF